MKRYSILVLTLLFWLFAVLQGSFFSNFKIFGTSLNLILILVFLFNIFNPKLGISAALLGGLFLDISTFSPIGNFIFIFIFLSFFLQGISKFFKKSTLVGFSLIFIFYFIVYKFFSPFIKSGLNFLFYNNFNFALNFNLKVFAIELAYNFLFIIICFIILRKYGNLLQKKKN